MTSCSALTDKLFLYQLLLVSEIIALTWLRNFPDSSVPTLDLVQNKGQFFYPHIASKAYVPLLPMVDNSPGWPQYQFTLNTPIFNLFFIPDL